MRFGAEKFDIYWGEEACRKRMKVREPKAFNLSGLRCLLNVKVELSGRHLAMNLGFRRKSGHTQYLVLRPNEREEV